ncbi:MAG: hypothetical protein O3C34_11085 [Proteobacteria bacterium]|nr:hypothetical protein [Pseudomonadota bacterium]
MSPRPLKSSYRRAIASDPLGTLPKAPTDHGSVAGTKLRSAGDAWGSPAESDLAALLDRHRHDEAMHRKMIELDRLPTSIADRLLRLVGSAALRQELVNRHGFSADVDREAIKSSRDRPQWWHQITFS